MSGSDPCAKSDRDTAAAELPLGDRVDWTPALRPKLTALTGRHVTVRALRVADAEDLYPVSHPPTGDPGIWTYLSEGPFESVGHMREMLEINVASEDPLFFALVPHSSGRAAGVATYMRITPGFGVIEIGNIWFGVPLRRTTAASEAIFLLARHAFDDLGYRRLEWKCNALNAASRRAAERFGFTYEGIFRQHLVVKGRSRDTAWYAIIDGDWPRIRSGFEAWLAPENFDSEGRQRRRLEQLIASGQA
jgi:RimJ/RimL family protein N-acetyltransferase